MSQHTWLREAINFAAQAAYMDAVEGLRVWLDYPCEYDCCKTHMVYVDAN